jgi:ribonuclease J
VIELLRLVILTVLSYIVKSFNHVERVEHRTPHLKLCTLSGNSEVGRNCSFVEDRQNIILVDAGLSFPEQEIFGIDYLIPNLDYLQKNKQKVRAIFITHGHLDHIGALPFILPLLGYPKVYAGSFASELIKQKLREFKILDKTRIIVVQRNTRIQIGRFTISFIGVTHSIPHAFSVFIESAVGNIFFSGDFKIDETPANEQQTDYETLRNLRGKVDLALIESTNSTSVGQSRSETQVSTTIEELLRSASGRVFVASFASQVSRLYVVSKIASQLDKKVVLLGRSLKEAFRIAKELKYIDLPESLFITPADFSKYPDNRIVILCTGSQGEQFGALSLLSRGENRFVKIKPGDKVILSSSEIPGNEYKIGRMTDRLIKLGCELITNKLDSVHATGHGLQDDLKTMFELIQPKKVMPIHGTLTMRYFNKRNFVTWGMKSESIYLTDDGQVWEVNRERVTKAKPIISKPVLIDAMGISDVGDVVLKDRETLAEYGMMCIVLNLSQKNKHILGRIRFASRGFIYMNRSEQLLKELERQITQIHKKWLDDSRETRKYEISLLRDSMSKHISKFLYKQTKREPLIMVVIT